MNAKDLLADTPTCDLRTEGGDLAPAEFLLLLAKDFLTDDYRYVCCCLGEVAPPDAAPPFDLDDLND